MIRMREETVWDSMERCEEKRVTIEGPRDSFQDFLAKSEKSEVVGFFTEIINVLRSKAIGWQIVIYHGGEARKNFSGPISADRCMSCDLRTSMMTGLTGTGAGGLAAGDSLIYEDDMMRYWHDAKGRSLFVVTPKRHVRALHELTTDELYQLWGGSIQILNDMGCGLTDLKDMILNAGLDQNHEHLHLKVRVHSSGFEKARSRWSSKRRRLVDKLRDFADDL